MSMSFEQILNRLLPLLEKKLNFMQSMAERAMSLEEKKEANKTDLEYKKLEASITGEKEKLKWEKEKLTTTIKGNYDLEMAKQQGLVTLKNIDKMSAKEVAEIQTASQERINKYGNDAKNLPELLKIGVGQKVKTTDPVTGAVTESLTGGSPEATRMGTELGRKMGLAPRQSDMDMANQDIAAMDQAKARETAGILKAYSAAGNSAAGREIYNGLDPNVKALLDPMLKAEAAGGAALPKPGVQATRTGLQAVTPAEPTRPVIQPVGGQPVQQVVAGQPTQQMPKAVEPARPELQPIIPTEGNSPAGSLKPAEAIRTGVQNWLSWRDKTLAERTGQEEERRRARRRAQGLTIGGF